MRGVAAGCVLLAALTNGCGQSSKSAATATQSGQPEPVVVPDDDADMIAAVKEARKTLPRFLDALRNRHANQNGFAVKKIFGTGTSNEHMWVQEVTYDGKGFHGTLANDPVQTKGLKFGDPVTVAPQELSDWMYVEDGKIVGGLTMRIMWLHLSPAEKKEMPIPAFKD